MAKTTQRELASVLSVALILHLAKGWQIVKRRAETVALKTFKVTLREIWVLLVASSTRPVTQKQMAEHLGLNQNVIVLLVDKLEKSGHVKRIRNPRNRREQFVRLTAKGRPLLRTVMGERVKYHRAILAPLTDDHIRTVLEAAQSVLAFEDALAKQRGPKPQNKKSRMA